MALWPFYARMVVTNFTPILSPFSFMPGVPRGNPRGNPEPYAVERGGINPPFPPGNVGEETEKE